MKKLVVSKETFTDMLSGLIASGVTFDAEEKNNMIVVTFTGGF